MQNERKRLWRPLSGRIPLEVIDSKIETAGTPQHCRNRPRSEQSEQPKSGMQNIRKRIQTLERFQSLRGGTAIDQTVRRALACVSDADLHLLESAAAALAQGRELTPAESVAAEAYASAVARESAGR